MMPSSIEDTQKMINDLKGTARILMKLNVQIKVDAENQIQSNEEKIRLSTIAISKLREHLSKLKINEHRAGGQV